MGIGWANKKRREKKIRKKSKGRKKPKKNNYSH